MEASDPLAGSGASAARALSAAAAAPAAIADDVGPSTGSASRKAVVRKRSLEALLGITFDTAAPVAAASDNWSAIGLLSGLKLHAALGPLLMAERSESETELAYVKRLEEADVLRLLCGGSAESPLVTALAACVWQGLADLKGSKAASATVRQPGSELGTFTFLGLLLTSRVRSLVRAARLRATQDGGRPLRHRHER